MMHIWYPLQFRQVEHDWMQYSQKFGLGGTVKPPNEWINQSMTAVFVKHHLSSTGSAIKVFKIIIDKQIIRTWVGRNIFVTSICDGMVYPTLWRSLAFQTSVLERLEKDNLSKKILVELYLLDLHWKEDTL